MSSAFDRKTEKINRREERARKEQQEKRRIRIIAVTVIVIFALLVAGALVINSKFIRRSVTAITIGGVNFSAAEFDYFYNNAYNEYSQYMNTNLGDYAASYLPVEGQSHSSQIQNFETGETWADYFINYTIDQISGMVKYYNAAMAAGYELPDEARASIDDEIAMYRLYAELYQYPSLDAFLQQNVGTYMNEKCLRNVIDFAITATTYSQHIHDSFTYSQGELDGYYSENRDSLDSFTYRYFLVKSETVTRDDYESDEEYDEVNEAALAEAREFASLILQGVVTEEDFIDAAREYSEADYADPDSTLRVYPGSWLGSSTYGPWMQEEGRQFGDVTTSDISTGTYVVFFIDRDANEYVMPEMRQILIQRSEVNADDYLDGEYDPEYIEAVENSDPEAWARAQTVMDLFIEGGATEEKLIELMADNSDDTTEGGLYKEITRNSANNKMVPEIENWLFAPERKIGDYALIRTEAYGYHLVYFMGYGERYRDFLADDALREGDYTAWEESLAPVEAVKQWAFKFTSH